MWGDHASAVVTRCQEEPVFCFIVPGLQEEIPPIIKHVGLNGKIIYRWGNFSCHVIDSRNSCFTGKLVTVFLLKLQAGAVQIIFVYQRVAITEQIGKIGDGLGFTPSVNELV